MTHDPSDRNDSTALSTEEVEIAAELQAHLSQAKLLLAQTRLQARTLVESAEAEAERIIETARETGRRIVADARSQAADIGLGEPSSRSFSELWTDAEEQLDLTADGFFLTIPERPETDVFNG